jgi:hypothetical protein
MVEDWLTTNWETSWLYTGRKDPNAQMGSPTSQKLKLSSFTSSTMTMEDYGLARLSELTEQLSSSDATEINTRIEEIVTILSDLAASLRDGESSPKLGLTLRIHTRTATGVCITHYAGQNAVIRDREQRISVVLAGWTCGSKLWCRKLSVLINSGSSSS